MTGNKVNHAYFILDDTTNSWYIKTTTNGDWSYTRIRMETLIVESSAKFADLFTVLRYDMSYDFRLSIPLSPLLSTLFMDGPRVGVGFFICAGISLRTLCHRFFMIIFFEKTAKIKRSLRFQESTFVTDFWKFAGIFLHSDSRRPLMASYLKFVLKENCRKFSLGVTKYLKKVSWRQVTWLQFFQKNCHTNSIERQTLVMAFGFHDTKI